ncbi:MAG: gluconate 2-dehydrogenase subunit 3 family protein [Longimicrobiales bacterium]
MDRRTALRALAAATALPVIPSGQLAGLLNARRTVECGLREDTFRLLALNAHEVELVKVIADTILPPSDTPGATDVGVHEFVDLIVAEWMDEAERDTFTQGLRSVDDWAQEVHGAGFLNLSPENQFARVAALDSEMNASAANDGESPGQRPFFWWMKRLTLTGYFTSEAGAALTDYRIIPGAFEGCLSGGPAQ